MGRYNAEEIEKGRILQGSDIPIVDGGYLYLYRNNELLGIAAVPSPNLMAETNRDSAVFNNEYFVDSEGNEYEIEIVSSMYGLDWQIVNYPEDSKIWKELRVEVKPNEY